MKLSAEDTELFYKIQSALLLHVNRELKLAPAARSLDEIRNLELDDKIKIRDAMWKHDTLLDSFVEANPFKLDGRELELVGQWRRHRIEGRFLVVAYLKSHTVFFEQVGQIPYGVCALQDDLQIILGSRLPVMVEAVLLPFKERIIYDGLISSYRITFGSGARRSINDVFQQAKAKHGIVTRLPYSPESEEAPSELEMLKFYLKNERNRQQYQEEIWDLTHNNPQMLTAYHQIMGKNHARHYGKEFRKMDINGGWFAILQGLIVASGVTEEEAEKAMKKIVPTGKRSWVYLFHFKK
jgi:hypothetical protein